VRAITRRSAWPAPPAMVPPYAPVWAPAPVVRPPAASGVAAAARACASAAVVGVPAQPAAQRSSTSCLRGFGRPRLYLEWQSKRHPNTTINQSFGDDCADTLAESTVVCALKPLCGARSAGVLPASQSGSGRNTIIEGQISTIGARRIAQSGRGGRQPDPDRCAGRLDVWGGLRVRVARRFPAAAAAAPRRWRCSP
jgi:hypothetical protein